MPAIVAPALATSALGTGAAIGAGIGGAGLALGTGLAAGSALAGGAGIAGLLGGMGGAGAAGSMLGGAALSPAVASLAPAATAQAMGPTLLQASTLPGMQGGLGALAPSVAPGATSGLASALPGAGSQFAQVAPNLAGRSQVLEAFARPELGQNLTQLGPNFAGQVTSLTPQTTGAAQLQAAGGAPTSNMAQQIQASQLRSAGSAALPADTAAMSGIQPGQNFLQNAANFFQNPSMQGAKDYAEEHPYVTSAAVGLGTKGLMDAMKQEGVPKPEDKAMIRPYTYERTQRPEAYAVSPTEDSSERRYFNEQFIAGEPYKATEKAEGGIAAAYAVGGPVEQMAALNAVGTNTGYPMANLQTSLYANPAMQRPEATNVVAPSADVGVGAYTGEAKFATGGISDLGGYSDGGRLLKGPGDGVSDSIPASIGGRQPARLADGEFVVPARIVSELGNGSTEAGARKLYAMMDRIQKGRRKTVGKGKVAVNSKAEKHLPA